MAELESLIAKPKRQFELGISRIVPERLYHYTTAEGLKGVLSSGQIWATDITYLNDVSEYTYSERLLSGILAKEHQLEGPAKKLLLDIMGMHPLKLLAVYVTCFCERGDLLSQWRAYGGNGTGYAIELDGSFLSALSLDSEDMLLGSVEYKLTRQKESLRNAITQLAAAIERYGTVLNDRTDKEVARLRENGLEEIEALRRIVREGIRASSSDWADEFRSVETFLTLYVQLAFGRAFLKSKTFAEEKEWRLAKFVLRNRVSDLCFRTMHGMFVPYIPIDLRGRRSAALPITRVLIGPTLHPEKAKESLERFLLKANMKQIEVVASKIPLRV